jgi:hypothetical protein
MKLNYDQPVLMLSGKPYKAEDGTSDMLLREIITMVCSMPCPGDDQLDPVKKYKIGEIAMLVHKGLDLAADQIVVVKDRVAKGLQSPVLVYQVHQILEGEMPVPDKAPE